MRVVRSHNKVHWQRDEPGSPIESKKSDERLQKYADQLAQVKSAKYGDKPSLVFFYTSKLEKLSSKSRSRAAKPKPTKEAAACNLILDKCFAGENDPDCVAAALSKFFVCVKVDVTTVSKKDNPEFCHESAPTILLLDKKGVVVERLKGSSKCSGKNIAKAMASVLKTEHPAASTLPKKLDKLFKDLVKAEKEISQYKDAISKAESRIAMARKKKASEKSLKKPLKELEDKKEDLAKVEKRRDGLLQEEKDIIAAAGLAVL